MLHFVTALEAEARPFIQHYRLKRDPAARAFQVFRRGVFRGEGAGGGDAAGGGDVALVISGIGKVSAAAATAFLAATEGRGQAVWLNVGVAGHATRAVGEAILAHKIRDAASGRTFYPPLVLEPPCASDPLTTVDVPETRYASPGAYDMEASGFYPTACRFSSAELVHCLKIVSDGPAASVHHLTLQRVRELVAEQVDLVAGWAESCRPLAAELAGLAADPPDLASCRERFRFTVSELVELRRLLVRRRTLAPASPLPLDELAAGERGGIVNGRLRAWLDGLAAGAL